MLVYLTHEKNGTHIVYTPLELETCLKNGWKVKRVVEGPEEVRAMEPKETTLHLPKKRGRPAKAK